MGLIKMNGVNYWGSAYGQGIIAPMIYSEEEIEVGVWTDGKPIYQKTVHISALPDSTHIGQYVDYPHGIADIENIIDYEGLIRFSNGTSLKFIRLGFNVNAFVPSVSIDSYCNLTNIRIMCGSDRSNTSADYTIWYTKTTDTAGSGTYTPSKALAVHYSTNEQVIGTWINGKTLYERVVQINSLPADTNTTAYPHGISDIDTICDYDFIIHWSNGNTAKADRIQMFSGTFQANGAIAVFVNDTNISVSCGQDRSALSGDCIIRYTKTTD